MFPVLKDASSHFKSLGEDLMSHRLHIILKTSIISPRRCLYANEGHFNLSIYISLDEILVVCVFLLLNNNGIFYVNSYPTIKVTCFI